ncbi:MAG: hypothetical protein WA960_11755 [Tunicatimonas sp.]
MKKILYSGAFLLSATLIMGSCSYKTCPAYSSSAPAKPYYSQQTTPNPTPVVIQEAR